LEDIEYSGGWLCPPENAAKIEEDSAMATYSIGDLSRREILRMSAILGVTSVVSTKFAFAQAALLRTPGQILGPFYPMKPFDQNADLTKVPGRPGRAEGEILNVMGRVLNLKGEPVRNAKVEVWQANAHGRYTHPSDTNPAPLDPNFEGSAVLTTDSEGRYRFKTIKPAAYPVGPNTIRPAHIHFEVYGQQDRLVTQMYFERRPLQQYGSLSAKCGATGIAHHEAIAAASRVRSGVEIGGIRHRAVRGLISSAQGNCCGDAPTSGYVKVCGWRQWLVSKS
jgi:protocatechuate 3,4-dioxygenase beta subunit